MNPLTTLPDKIITPAGSIARIFLSMAITQFVEACRWVHELPYGYNSKRDDGLILFKEKMGTCTTKHAVIATLAEELDIPITKCLGIYPMTETIVTGTQKILTRYDLPYVPMLHCFLEYGNYRVDLTEGNLNGKNGSIDDFLFTTKVTPNITEREEYLVYRQALKDTILARQEMLGINTKRILKAREEGLRLLKSNIRIQIEH